jgi:hypothetical protein
MNSVTALAARSGSSGGCMTYPTKDDIEGWGGTCDAWGGLIEGFGGHIGDGGTAFIEGLGG